MANGDGGPGKTLRTTCGAHREIARGRGMKVTQCPCGTIHVHLDNGISLRFDRDRFAELADTIGAARSAVAGIATGNADPNPIIN